MLFTFLKEKRVLLFDIMKFSLDSIYVLDLHSMQYGNRNLGSRSTDFFLQILKDYVVINAYMITDGVIIIYEKIL